MTTWIALLRGINVGGAKRVPMAQLRELVAGLGFERVRTYVQSGNVLLDDPAGRDDGAAVARRLAEAIREAFGFDVDVVVRSRDELAAVVAGNPYPQADDAPTTVHVVFLGAPLEPAALADVDPAAFAPDAFALAGRELYLLTPGGLGRSRLAARLTGARLGGPATARNWRTVRRLLALADDAA